MAIDAGRVSPSRRKLLGGLGALALLGALLLAHWAGDEETDGSQPPASTASSAWPAPQATLTPPTVSFPLGFGRKRIYLDAGHGAPDNTGNVNAFCEDEQDFTLRTARWVARWLEETGHFEVQLSRRQGELVAYRDRVEQARAWHAAAFISIHSDVRGPKQSWAPDAGLSCPRTDEGVGFSVLWSDEGPMPLQLGRLALARAVGKRLVEAGLSPYDGTDYRGQYRADALQAGVFVDRHEPGKRIYVLRKPAVPAIIVETHNAWLPAEAVRWEQEATREAFAAALAAALTDVLR